MDPHFLLKDELEFELACRGVGVRAVVPVLRKLFKEILITEQTGEYSHEIKAPKHSLDSPSEELETCAAKLKVLAQYITELTDRPDKPLFRRLVSRLIHVQNRLALISPEADREIKLISELKHKGENLLALLEERDEPPVEGELSAEDKHNLVETLGEIGNKIIKKLEESNNGMAATTSKVTNHPQIERKTCTFEDCFDDKSKAQKLFRCSTMEDGVTNRKLVPISTWGIKFSGRRNLSVNAFIERVEEIKEARNARDVDLWRYAIDFFEDDALIWYRANKDRVCDWEELVFLLKRTFQSPYYQEELLEEIKARTQGKDESAVIYIFVIQNMFNRLPNKMTENEKIQIIIRNLQPYFQRAVCRDTFSSIDDLVNILQLLERTKRNCDTFQEPQSHRFKLEPDLAYKPSTSIITHEIQETAVVAEITDKKTVGSRCWNCRETGHLFRACTATKQRQFCYKCGRFGVTSKNCPCKGNASGEGPKPAK